MTCRWVYDLDETLVGTRSANVAAYAAVGVTPPDDFHVRPWQEWCSPTDHDNKCSVFPRYLARYGKELLASRLLRETGGEVLTNASSETYGAVIAVFPFLRQYRAHVEMRPDDKLAWLLEGQDSARGAGVYLDDSSAFVERVRRETRWQVLDTSGF